MGIASHLIKSPKTGTYSYRRAVPSNLIPIVGKREIKVSLKTKNLNVARSKAAHINRRVDSEFRQAKARLEPKAREIKPASAIREAREMAREYGALPEQAPDLTKVQTAEEFQAFVEEAWNWLQQRDELIGEMASELVDEEQRQKDYEAGMWGKPGYRTPYRKADTSEPEFAAIEIVKGKLDVTVEPSLQHAFDAYLDEKLHGLDEVSARRLKVRKQRAMSGLAKYLGRGNEATGMKTKLRELGRGDVREYYHRRTSERTINVSNREFNDLQAIFNFGLREFELTGTKANVFSRVKSKDPMSNRTSLNPEQLKAYVNEIKQHPNPQLRLIGLMTVHLGCRISEAIGLMVDEVHIDGTNIPWLALKPNEIRDFGKGSLARNPVLVGELLEAFRGYDLPELGAAFPKYGNSKGGDNVSAALRKLLRKAVGKIEGLVPHSARHTWKDRARAAGIETAVADYLVGHRSSHSTVVAQSYGTGLPPASLQDAMVRIEAVEDWGDFR